MDYKEMTFYWNILQTVLLVLLGAWNYIGSRQQANKSAVNAIDKKVLLLEEQIKSRITHSDLSKVHQRISEVAQLMEHQDGQLKQMNKTLGLINQHLLSQAGH